jgi:hypothetical protein
LNIIPSIEEAVSSIDINKTGSIKGKEIIEKIEIPVPDFALSAPSIVTEQANASPPETDVIKNSNGSLISICIKKIKRTLNSSWMSVKYSIENISFEVNTASGDDISLRNIEVFSSSSRVNERDRLFIALKKDISQNNTAFTFGEKGTAPEARLTEIAVTDEKINGTYMELLFLNSIINSFFKFFKISSIK